MQRSAWQTCQRLCTHMPSHLGRRASSSAHSRHSRRSRSAGSACASAVSDQPSTSQQAAPAPGAPLRVTAQDLSGKGGKLRLDAYLAAVLPDASRAKIQASIKGGLVQVNGAAQKKAAHSLRSGDMIHWALLPPAPCTATPEAIPLDVVYEDDAVIVINKPAGMVVHISPGHTSGTLVNALLHHAGLPAMDVLSGSMPLGLLGGDSQGDDEDADEDEDEGFISSPLNPKPPAGGSYPPAPPGIVRPGIVHRLDKGTSGLIVVAKDDRSHARLCEQFKARTVSRVYWSVTLGVPPTTLNRTPAPPSPWPSQGAASAASFSGRVETNIVRDPSNRLRMTTAAYGSHRGRTAASRYRVLQVLAGGAAALVEWRLETGRTHQIRVHAKHLGHPLFADDVYGAGTAASIKALIGKRASRQAAAKSIVERFGSRPALHAKTLGFEHPVTGKMLHFESQLPPDLERLLADLETLNVQEDAVA